ncbi:hypothetical protein [Microbacterium sp. A93]|uniref:hypothetical protein n=1 Tax=Microbacterium sp. A93 TaxID=3450716 RepID=UPI003F43F4BD
MPITGWNRDHALQKLRRRAAQPPGRATATVAVLDRRKTKPRKYSYGAMVVLRRIWAASGGFCGKYLAASMSEWIEAMESHGALVEEGKTGTADRCGPSCWRRVRP